LIRFEFKLKCSESPYLLPPAFFVLSMLAISKLTSFLQKLVQGRRFKKVTPIAAEGLLDNQY